MNSPIKWHGGKYYLAKKIVKLMPRHLHYVEPYFGSGAVLFAKNPEGVSEVINDINLELTWFWRVLQNPDLFDQFRRIIEAVPVSEFEYKQSSKAKIELKPAKLYLPERAVAFFIQCRQSLAGRMKGFTGITKTRTRRGMNGEASAWISSVEGLPAVHSRLRRVVILSRPALEVIKGQDGKKTLFYLDPTYLHETRATTGEYAHEMDKSDHRKLLEQLALVRGKFILSGYDSQLYNKHAKHQGWNCHQFELPNNAASGKEKRRMIECLWTNF